MASEKFTFDKEDRGFLKALKDAGYKIPHPATLEALNYNYPDQYEKRLQSIWERYKQLETLKCYFGEKQWEVEIPLNIRGQLWSWVCSKPVANQNPYKTLFDHLGTGVNREDILMYLSADNTPDSFDKRTKYNENWVKEDPSLEDDEIRIELKQKQHKSLMKEYRDAMRDTINLY